MLNIIQTNCRDEPAGEAVTNTKLIIVNTKFISFDLKFIIVNTKFIRNRTCR